MPALTPAHDAVLALLDWLPEDVYADAALVAQARCREATTAVAVRCTCGGLRHLPKRIGLGRVDQLARAVDRDRTARRHSPLAGPPPG